MTFFSLQLVFGDVSNFIKKSLPFGTVNVIEIEDPKQLEGKQRRSKSNNTAIKSSTILAP